MKSCLCVHDEAGLVVVKVCFFVFVLVWFFVLFFSFSFRPHHHPIITMNNKKI